MDKNEFRTKLFKGITIALPVLLVAILALMIVIAMDLAGDNSVPALGDNVGTTSSDEGGENPPDEPIEDPSSKGLLFISYGDGTCALDGMGSCTDTFIVVPMESPEGDIVVEIADNAFKNCASIRGIELPGTVTRIGDYAFYGSSIREIEIPSTVKEIGNYALVGCKYLTDISVDSGSRSYSSSMGILYSKDGTVLITYPAGKMENTVIIAREVEKIENMAFYKCVYVKMVTYHGTSASWRTVEIGAGNDVIDEAVIYFSSSSDK